MPTLRNQYSSTGRSTIGLNTPTVDDNWLYDEMKVLSPCLKPIEEKDASMIPTTVGRHGEADNLADYVKDLLDRRGDGDPRVAALTTQNRKLGKQIRDLEEKVRRLKKRLQDKDKGLADKDSVIGGKDDEIAALKRQMAMMEKV
eukprot:scaffold102004_cov37-Prasinocladus_malaysianus.AAC.1